jgi:RNA polymerase primary sigma factor
MAHSQTFGGLITEREVDVVCLRFGIGDPNEEGKSLQEIADIYGVSRERIRQIEQRALGKMRKHPAFKPLRPFVQEV